MKRFLQPLAAGVLCTVLAVAHPQGAQAAPSNKPTPEQKALQKDIEQDKKQIKKDIQQVHKDIVKNHPELLAQDQAKLAQDQAELQADQVELASMSK